MSVFNKIVEIHAKEKTEAEHAAATAVAAKKAVEEQFVIEFKAKIQSVAKPIFEEFVADAIAHGFPATVEEREDGKGNPLLSLSIIPMVGAKFSFNKSEECVYTIKAIITEQKVEHISYFDQRIGKKGIKSNTLGIQSISQSFLERELGEFLSFSLKSQTV